MEPVSAVLIVDDEPFGRDTLEALLWPEGYALYFAPDGPSALARLAETPVDAILLDVMMPEIDGFEVCRQIRADARLRHIPIVLVTALDSKEDLARGLNAGADEFLSKPVNGIELRARVRAMLRIKRQYDQLASMLQLRENLANMIVHDMRSPLTVIGGYSEILAMKSEQADVDRDMFQAIFEETNRLNQFVNDLLLLAKMESGQLLLNRVPADVNRLALEVQKTYDIIAQSRAIRLCLDAPADPRWVGLDVHLWRRVLDNLLSNALKFAPPNSGVIFRVEYPVDHSGTPHLRFSVLDEGPGIPLNDRQRIFDKFEIVEMKKEGLSQVGLGLAFCKMVVEAHGGCIRVEDNHPKGSAFIVEI